ncbi:MAG: adenylate/guanylate cyclase domain-containing protein [Helicobacteraceae bacterium]|jgi:adenylate cyclase|nr:adenylate/guanylate cyclase domain-containing protein [Helicobacteraceae bacterium]
MKKSVKSGKKIAALFWIALLVFFLTAMLERLGLLEKLENVSYDGRVNMLSALSRPSDDIIVVLLDEPSIAWAQENRSWGFPWPRDAFGEITDYMRLSNASALMFDVIFSEPSLYSKNNETLGAIAEEIQTLSLPNTAVYSKAQTIKEVLDRDDDRIFAQALRQYKKGVLATFFSSQERSGGAAYTLPDNLDIPVFNLDGAPTIDGDERLGVRFPIEKLLRSTGALGSVSTKTESDGIVRRAALYTLFDGKAVPGLSSAALLLNGAQKDIAFNKGNGEIRWGKYIIPVDEQGGALLKFRGSLDRYQPYSAASILRSYEAYKNGGEPELPPENFEGRFVFFGYYAAGLFDICATPISSAYPGMGVHITMLDNILQQDFIRPSPLWFNYLLIALAAMLATAAPLFIGRVRLLLGVMFVVLLALFATAYYGYYINWKIPLASPFFGALLAFLTAAVYNYMTEGAQKRFIKSAFSQYLSPLVIEQLLENPQMLSLGGKRREISIFFSDIQGFTSISEKLDPTQLTEFLNDYLSMMSAIILDSGGTIDKYEGDAIIAFWNAPLTIEDHAYRALSAAIECQSMLEIKQEYFQKRYGFKLMTRIGLNTGLAVVGNMGSKNRFDYTMLGDSVNLAARLEGLNKQFGTYLMCSENTYKKALTHGEVFARKLADVAVVGKKEAVAVYEPMREEAFRQKERIIERFNAARELFCCGRLAEALAIFNDIKDIDPPSEKYAAQTELFLNDPQSFNAIWIASSK